MDPLKREVLLPCIGVLARGLRGIEGVQWLTEVAGGIDPTTGPQGCRSLVATFKWLAALVHARFEEECGRRGDHKWASHSEGRHAGLPGKCFISGLANPAAVELLIQNAQQFKGKFETV